MQKYHIYNREFTKLDTKDKKILEQLNKNARMTLTKVSKKTGIPIDTIKYRIEKMRKKDIFRYAIILNPLKIGYPIFNAVYLQLINFSEEQEQKLVTYIKTQPNLVYGAKTTGKYDFAVGIVAEDMEKFTTVLNNFKTKFQKIIKDLDVLSIIEEYKYDYLIDLIE